MLDSKTTGIVAYITWIGLLIALVAGDRENYDDIILNVSDISSVYKVKGKLIINS